MLGSCVHLCGAVGVGLYIHMGIEYNISDNIYIYTILVSHKRICVVL